MELVGELESIARTGGGDTAQAIKTLAGALAEALGPTSHEKAVAQEQLARKHGQKTPEAHAVAPLDDVEGRAARGRDVDQAELEKARDARAEERLEKLEKPGEGEVPKDRVNVPEREQPEGEKAPA
jgi:hypothetical protein